MSPPTARNVLTLPPTGTSRRAIRLGEGFRIFPTLRSGEQPDCPSLRASNDHRFIVRVLRAQRMVWLLPIRPSEAARCASTGDSPGHPPLLAALFSSLLFREPGRLPVYDPNSGEDQRDAEDFTRAH
jgi:hypothetical protein